MAKSAEAFRTISEVAEWLDLPTHVLRFWESKFTQVKPVKRAGGRRYYRPNDMALLGGIKKLLHDDGMTIKGAQKMLRDHGVKHVSSLSQALDGEFEETSVDITAVEPVTATVVDAPLAAEVVPFTHRQSSEQTEAKTLDAPEPVQETEEGLAAEEEPPTAPAESSPPEASEKPEDEPVPSASPETDTETDREPGLKTRPSTLPSFLQPAKEDGAPQAAPVSLSISLPDDPSDTELDVNAGLLSRIAAFKSTPEGETRRVLEQARQDLKALSS